jgi:KilA-N domain
MSNLIREWNGRTIRQRADGYLSATDMCQACGKRWDNWSRLDSTGQYLKVLHDKHYSDVSECGLIDANPGGSPETTGTWVYRKVAIRLAQWLSPEFAVQVDEWIEELFTTGKIVLESEQKPIQLPPADIRVTNLLAALDSIGFEVNNPRYNQSLKDLAGDILGLNQNQLPLSNDCWAGVAERAEQLGYAPALVVNNRSQLGKYVAAVGLESKKESRLCNGTERPINLYKVCDRLDSAIVEFMDAKVLAQ